MSEKGLRSVMIIDTPITYEHQGTHVRVLIPVADEAPLEVWVTRHAFLGSHMAALPIFNQLSEEAKTVEPLQPEPKTNEH